MDALINIDNRAIAKLIELVSSAIGTLYRPRQIRKEAEAKAYAIKTIEKAKTDAFLERRFAELNLEDRVVERIVAKEIRRQENIDSIVQMAAQNLLEEDSVSQKPVDVDWATRFFEYAQDITKEEMKVLWAKILAKEVKTPSSFSLRTLDVLRNITSEEAETFEKVGKFVMYESDCFIYNNSEVLERFDIKFSDIVFLRDCGILMSTDFIVKNYSSDSKENSSAYVYCGNYCIRMTIPKNHREISIPVHLLTRVGQELLTLIEIEGNLDYMRSWRDAIKKEGPNVTVEYAKWMIEGGKIVYTVPFVEL